jgi:hypothetical protein
MSKLILNNNYLLKIDNRGLIKPKKDMQKNVNKHYKFIKKNGNKLLFTNGENNVTLWRNNCWNGFYSCYITLERNNKYRTTKFCLNSNSVYVLIKIYQIEINYLISYLCIRTLNKFTFIIDFYNKINVKKNFKKVQSITKVFQNNYMVRYISEFL